jgi:3-deoxy-D-arabino-heptulosonate 7-phosphate (DAHP) synthase
MQEKAPVKNFHMEKAMPVDVCARTMIEAIRVAKNEEMFLTQAKLGAAIVKQGFQNLSAFLVRRETNKMGLTSSNK